MNDMRKGMLLFILMFILLFLISCSSSEDELAKNKPNHTIVQVKEDWLFKLLAKNKSKQI